VTSVASSTTSSMARTARWGLMGVESSSQAGERKSSRAVAARSSAQSLVVPPASASADSDSAASPTRPTSAGYTQPAFRGSTSRWRMVCSSGRTNDGASQFASIGFSRQPTTSSVSASLTARFAPSWPNDPMTPAARSWVSGIVDFPR